MTFTKEKAIENLSRLIAKFDRELAAGKISEYNEEAAKIAFIQPLLKDVLGWDVNDHNEVGPEERTSRGRVDYGLKVEGKIKIFVEAKPPKVDLDRHIEQAIRYGYNRKGVPFVLLTDFEALKLFDVTVKPDIRNPLKGLKLDLEYKQYLDQFDRIWQLSKESIVAGKLDELLRVRPKDRLPVDKAILEDLKTWREILAKDIFKNNQDLFHSGDHEKDANYLKEIAQKILDRIIFMRSCEDRGLYHGDKLKNIFEERSDTVGTNTMVFLKKEFESYNIFFDSDLFRPNEWETKLAVDFKVMKEVVLGTYNPYQFDVIPLEVLGNIYEQYLGYTIRLTDHQVKYELKPEVRKAGGIYYTPEYIVDYIVKNTVGKLLQELPSNKSKKLRILDPACGSGSFLIRAYEEMLNYYQEQKTKKAKPGEGEKKLGLPDQKLRLKIHEKKEILINHIFGVDIDEQAVEVTKLSLMLNMLDGERGIPAGRGILPMLDKNIKCGNSLISGNPLELHKYFGEDWYKVKPFNWEDEFSQIMKEEGGFDVVIGNPPWGADIPLVEEKYFRKSFSVGTKSSQDSYEIFMERAIGLLKPKGKLGYITPDTFLRKDDHIGTRYFLLHETSIEELIETGPLFSKVRDTWCLISTICKIKANKEHKIKHRRISRFVISSEDRLEKFRTSLWDSSGEVRQSFWTNKNDLIIGYLTSEVHQQIISKIEAFTRLSELKDHFLISRGEEGSKFDLSEKTDGDFFMVIPKDIERYYVSKGMRLFSKDLTPTKVKSFYKHSKIWIIRIQKMRWKQRIVAGIDERQNSAGMKTLQLVISPQDNLKDLKYLCALLSSKLINFWCINYLADDMNQSYLEKIPVRVNFKSSERYHYNKILAFVEIMVGLNNKIHITKGAEKDQIQRQIEKTDREIDDLVYKLYGITDDEKRLIEGEIDKKKDHS